VIHTIGNGYEVNQWSSQGYDSPGHRAEHVVIGFPCRVAEMEFTPMIRLKSRRAAQEMLNVLRINIDAVWNEDGTLKGNKTQPHEDVAPADDNGVRVAPVWQTDVREVKRDGVVPAVRLTIECGDDHVALQWEDPDHVLGTCKELFEATMRVWPPAADDEPEPRRDN
jgi:hypothetical protein